MLFKVAAFLAAATFLIHFIVGGADALAPMLAASLDDPAEGAMHACWHIVSFFLAWSAYIFWTGSRNVSAAKHFAIVWIAAAIVFIFVGIFQSGSRGLVVNPQWTILFASGTLVLIAVYREPVSGRSEQSGSTSI